MSLRSSEAIVLDVYELHEFDRIVTLLTRDFGKRRAVARGARRRFSRFAGQLQLLSKAHATWYEKEGSDLARLSSLATLRSADPLLRDLERILLTGFLAEHMVEFAQENEDDDRLFRLLDATTQALLDGVDGMLAARYYEAWILRLSGLYPEPIACPLCARRLAEDAAVIAAGEAVLVCSSCASGDSVAPGVVRFLRRIGHESLTRMAADPPSAEDLMACGAVSGLVRRSFLQYELKSERVMRETLAGLREA